MSVCAEDLQYAYGEATLISSEFKVSHNSSAIIISQSMREVMGNLDWRLQHVNMSESPAGQDGSPIVMTSQASIAAGVAQLRVQWSLGLN